MGPDYVTFTSRQVLRYYPPSQICDGYSAKCKSGVDAAHCDPDEASDDEGSSVSQSIPESETCTRYFTRTRTRIFNYTRCAAIEFGNTPYCEDFIDQVSFLTSHTSSFAKLLSDKRHFTRR